MTRLREASVRAWGLALVLFVMALAPAAADPGDEAALFGQLNGARVQGRLPTLARSAPLDAVARRHAARVAASPQPFHNPGLRAETPGWLAVGEVVGRITAGPGWESRLQQLFLSSPVHRRVILSAAYTDVGVGTARSASGDINAVAVFGRSSAPRPARPPRAPRAARAAGPPRSATTVAPPPPATTTTQPRARLALAPLAPGPEPGTSVAIIAMPVHRRARASTPMAAAGTAAQLGAVASLVSCATRSRRAGRPRRGR